MNPKDEKTADEALDEAQLIANDGVEPLMLPESPASANIKVWIKGYGVMITIRDTKVMFVVKKVCDVVDYAESHGWKNTWDTGVGKPTQAPVMPIATAMKNPRCPVHHVPFKEGKYGFYCPTKLEDGHWCKEKPA